MVFEVPNGATKLSRSSSRWLGASPCRCRGFCAVPLSCCSSNTRQPCWRAPHSGPPLRVLWGSQLSVWAISTGLSELRPRVFREVPFPLPFWLKFELVLACAGQESLLHLRKTAHYAPRGMVRRTFGVGANCVWSSSQVRAVAIGSRPQSEPQWPRVSSNDKLGVVAAQREVQHRKSTTCARGRLRRKSDPMLPRKCRG